MANPILQYGSQGGEVAWLSQVLGWWGYSPSMTDVYDWQTAEAVAQFQRSYGYEATGQMGPETWALMEALMQGMPAPNAVSTGPGNPQTGPLNAAPAPTGGAGVTPIPTNRDAKAKLSALLNQYGLSGMMDWVTRKLEDGASEAEIELEMYDQPAFKARFPVIEQRRKSGMNPVTAAEVLEFETRGREVLRRAGLTGQFMERSYLQNLMGVDVSLAELQDRIQDGLLKVTQAPPEVRTAFTAYFGTEGDVALAELFLDPTVAAPELEKKAMTAYAGGVGTRFGLTVAQGIAREIADTGITDAGIWQGYRKLDEMRSIFEESIGEGVDMTMENEGIGTVFGTKATAADQIGQRIDARVARFRGAGGAHAGEKGVSGMGVADS